MSKSEDRATIMLGLSQALDSIREEVSSKELVGYFTVLVFKDKKTGLLSSLENHGAMDYATSMLGFIHLSTRRLEHSIEGTESVAEDVVDDVADYEEIDKVFNGKMKIDKDKMNW